MGAIISSKKDINPVLVNQTPRFSNIIPTRPTSTNRTHLRSLPSIPVPVRPPGTTQADSLAVPSLRTEVNPTFDHPQTNLEPTFNHSTEHPSRLNSDFIQEQQFISPEMQFVQSLPRIHADPTIIARTVIDLNPLRRSRRHPYSFARPSQTVVERNGKRFVTELKERIERRYVQVYDESLGQMRFFEVTDYIPSRTVRAVDKGRVYHEGLVPSSKSSLAKQSALRDFRDLHDQYHDEQQLSTSNQRHDQSNTQLSSRYAEFSGPDSHQKPLVNQNSTRSSEKSSHLYDSTANLPPDNKNSRDPSNSNLYRSSISHPYSPAESNRMDTISRESYQSFSPSLKADRSFVRGFNTPQSPDGTVIDPFGRSVDVQPPSYTPRSRAANLNYTEPIVGRGSLLRVVQDYAPLTKPSNPERGSPMSSRSYYESKGLHLPETVHI